MKIGIYIPGLGQSFVNETVEKYATRLMNEMSYSTNGVGYEIKSELVSYSADRESTLVSICEKNGQNRVVYKFYDFNYHGILTDRFNGYSLILKNLWLFLLVIRKFPLVLKRLFFPSNYNRPFQTLYLFMIFLVMACSVILMLPATLSVIIKFLETQHINVGDFPLLSETSFENFSQMVVSFTAMLLLFLPHANVLITSLATEFVCSNDYIQHGVQKQLLQGNLELLVEYITEHEEDCKIHFHAYSFGSILALDYIYPYGNKVSRNAGSFCEAIITIGTPLEFVKSYYPQFYQDRNPELGDKLHWLNVYSISDALATNFRNDATRGDAEFGIEKASNKPVNLNYELVAVNKAGIVDFFMLFSIRVHGMYWDTKTEGKSCLGLVYDEMSRRNLVSRDPDSQP